VGLYSNLVQPVEMPKDEPIEKNMWLTYYIMKINRLNYEFKISLFGMDLVHSELNNHYIIDVDNLNFIYWTCIIWFHGGHRIFQYRTGVKEYRLKGKRILGSELTRCIRKLQ